MLLSHRGAVKATRDELDLVPLPEQTSSYIPVSHYKLADTIRTIGQDILTDYTLIGEDYAIARQGQQLFACLKFQNQKSFDIAQKDIALSVAFRNSYDRSMSIGIALGANVFVCDNMALRGDICVMKKHTLNVWAELENLAISSLYRSQKIHQIVIEESQRMKTVAISNDHAFEHMGLLYGKGIVSPRQLPVIKQEWLHPRHEEFQPRNKWSLYNAVTEALKSCPPVTIMEKHLRLHRHLADGDYQMEES